MIIYRTTRSAAKTLNMNVDQLCMSWFFFLRLIITSMTNSILCMLLKVLFHPSDSSRTWQNSSKLEPAYVHKNAQVSNGKPALMYFVPEVFGVHDFGKSRPKRCWCMLRNVRLTQDSMLSRISSSCSVTKTWSSQSHNCTLRTWAIQRYRELLKLIDESME